ncbi:MAG: hypothetical protein ACK5F7_03835 [Planctomycetaceae bacterium]
MVFARTRRVAGRLARPPPRAPLGPPGVRPPPGGPVRARRCQRAIAPGRISSSVGCSCFRCLGHDRSSACRSVVIPAGFSTITRCWSRWRIRTSSSVGGAAAGYGSSRTTSPTFNRRPSSRQRLPFTCRRRPPSRRRS